MRIVLRILAVVVLLHVATPAIANERIDSRFRRLADGRIAISLPTEIERPGSYVLTRNIERSGGPAVHVKAAHVKLDLNGFTVSCDRPQNFGFSCILVEASFVEVSNGFVQAHDDPADPPVLEGIAIRLPEASGGEWIEGFVIRNVTVNVTGGWPGISVFGSRGKIEDSRIVTDWIGIDAVGEEVVIRNNEVKSYFAIGLGCSAPFVCGANQVIGNTVSGMVHIGLGADANRVAQNLIHAGDVTPGLLVSGSYNHIEGNQVTNGTIRLALESSGNVYRGNVVRGGSAGFIDDGTDNTSHGDNYMPDRM